RLREGALAAVPDLADPDRPARSRPARVVGVSAVGGRARAYAALVPVPLLGPAEPLRAPGVAARPRTRPRVGDAGRPAGASGQRRARSCRLSTCPVSSNGARHRHGSVTSAAP